MFTVRRRFWAAMSLLAVQSALVLVGCEDFMEPTNPGTSGLLEEGSGFQGEGLGLEGMISGEDGSIILQDSSVYGLESAVQGSSVVPVLVGDGKEERCTSRKSYSPEIPESGVCSDITVAFCIADGTLVVVLTNECSEVVLVCKE
jgi:hypothetical protein